MTSFAKQREEMIKKVYICDLCSRELKGDVSHWKRLFFLDSDSRFELRPVYDEGSSEKVICRFCIECLKGALCK